MGTTKSNRAFCEWLKLPTGASVLDLGGGIGGPARFLAREYQCAVTAVDLSPDLVAAGREITRAMGLENKVNHVVSDAQNLHLNRQFDYVWIQHLDMQVPDKIALYSTAKNHLKPSGRVVWHDWLCGAESVCYPVMWSDDGSISFLANKESFIKNLTDSALTITKLSIIDYQTITWLEQTAQSLSIVLQQGDPVSGGSSPRHGALSRLAVEIQNTIESIKKQALIPIFACASPSDSR